jgi:uncharacterized membrane protein
MPSIPQSLLWISLVVLWLFVLVPMLISKRDAVRRTSDVALATRVLNGGAGSRLIKRSGPAAGHRSDPNWKPEDEPSEDDFADTDRIGDSGEHQDEDADTDERACPQPVVMKMAVAEDSEPDYLDVDVIEDSAALPVGASAQAAEPALVAVDAEAVASAADEADDDADRDESDVAADEYEYVDDSSGLEAPSEADLHIADSMSASRRRRKESATAEAVTARKYRFRARTLTVMAVLLLASAVAAYTWSSTMWWACCSVGVVAALYLAYLRRQTRIEARVRRRRAQRIARSRLGVENTADQEFDVVPARLRRPGAAVLEIDDEDPEFEHLDYVPFARHYDLPRAAGQ